jgi:hypothetical protein
MITNSFKHSRLLVRELSYGLQQAVYKKFKRDIRVKQVIYSAGYWYPNTRIAAVMILLYMKYTFKEAW